MQTLQQVYYESIKEASDVVTSRLGRASVAIVLGSGLSGFTSRFTTSESLAYSEIPHMPMTTVAGHSGRLVLGDLPNKSGTPLRVLCFSGRVHAYEGFHFEQVNFMARLAAACGCSLYILTNSAGGAIPGMVPGSAMVIRDHIRWTFVDPLRDVHDHRLCPPGYSPEGLYSERLAKLAGESAARLGQTLYSGTYCWTSGPTYETPAEVRAGMRMGGGVFGMSTVPEALAGHAVGMEVFGISLCTNLAAGIIDQKLVDDDWTLGSAIVTSNNTAQEHADVTRVAKEAGPRFEALLLDMMYHLDVLPGQTRFHTLLTPEQLALTSRHVVAGHPLHWSTEADIAADGHVLRDAFSNAVELPLAVFLSADRLESLLSRFATIKTVPLSTLKTFSVLSPVPACRGHIVLASISGSFRAIVFIAHSPEAGFQDYESHHLLGVLRYVGVNAVIQVVPASPLGAGPTPKAFVVTEVFDQTRDRLCPIFDSTSAALFKGLSSEATGILPQGHLSAFPSRSLPTLAERQFVRDITKSFAFTCTSLAPISSAAHLGMQCMLVAFICGDDVGLHDVILKTALDSTPCLAKEVRVRVAAEYIARCPVVQDLPQDVRTSTSFLRSSIPPGSSHAIIVVDPSLNGAIDGIAWKNSIPSSSIPGWPKHGRDEWVVNSGDWHSGMPVVCLRRTSFSLYSASHAIRVFKMLGIRHIVLIGKAISLCGQLPPGSVATVTDHINLSGECILSGPNVDEFGPRFPDMSRAYTPIDGASNTTVLAYVPNLNLASSKAAAALGFTSASNAIVPEVIVARHSGLDASAIVWMTTNGSGHPSGDTHNDIRSLVQRALPGKTDGTV
ncbi:purine-nucleoside phosphorylase [Plasmodiophora brassicae]